MSKIIKIVHSGELDNSIEWLMHYSKNVTSSKAALYAIKNFQYQLERVEDLEANKVKLLAENSELKHRLFKIENRIAGFKKLLHL